MFFFCEPYRTYNHVIGADFQVIKYTFTSMYNWLTCTDISCIYRFPTTFHNEYPDANFHHHGFYQSKILFQAKSFCFIKILYASLNVCHGHKCISYRSRSPVHLWKVKHQCITERSTTTTSLKGQPPLNLWKVNHILLTFMSYSLFFLH